MSSPPSDKPTTSTSGSTGSKDELRKHIRENLACLTQEDRKRSSALLAQKLADYLNTHFADARRIATFSALPHEPDLSSLHILLPQRQFYYPLVLSPEAMSFHLVTTPSTLKKGAFGLSEPDPQVHPPVLANDLDLILVPGLAFDPKGNRLGHGKGYYDRYLTDIPTVPTIGISDSTQLVPRVPHEKHDHPMTFLATESGVIPV